MWHVASNSEKREVRFSSSCIKTPLFVSHKPCLMCDWPKCERPTAGRGERMPGRTKVRRRHSSQKALEKVDTRMRNVRPSPRRVDPSVGRCFPLCGGSDDRDRDFGPDTFRGEEEKEGKREGEGEWNAQCRGILHRSRSALVRRSGTRLGSKTRSEKELDSRWGKRRRSGANEPTKERAKALLAAHMPPFGPSVVLAVTVRSIGSKDEIQSSPRAQRESGAVPFLRFGWAPVFLAPNHFYNRVCQMASCIPPPHSFFQHKSDLQSSE